MTELEMVTDEQGVVAELLKVNFQGHIDVWIFS
jgi:hypothetical protein